MLILTAGRFKQRVATARRAQKSAPVGDALLRKDIVSVVEALEDRRFRFTISTGNVDRDMDTIQVSGWDLTAYLRNPVVLFGHGFDPVVGTWPIGRAVDVGPDGGVLKATVEFDPEDMPVTGQAAEACVRKLRSGSLNATSVGFRPLEYDVSQDPDRDPDGWFPGIDFKRQELLEFSVVSVPANAEALLDRPSDQDDVPGGNGPPVVEAQRAAAAQAAKARRRTTERLLSL